MRRKGRAERRSLWEDVRDRALPLSPEEQVRPAAFLRAGAGDAATLLALRALRRAVWPLIIAGVGIAWLNNEFDAQTLSVLTNPEEYVAAFLSPLALLAVGWGLRILVSLAGLVIAAPLAQGAWVEGAQAVSRGRRLIDLAYLSAGYRSVRWSYAVQREAVARCGDLGRRLSWLETAGRVALPVAFAFLVWVALQDVGTTTPAG
ncbi:hypothetical protein ATJ88_1642 [Isoptericola jiangsuensis]|uniref:Uncharacterized protein n=1 Tax=Isoptericola jiangsuensis TaxID=548579 RepID=A0A2A9EXL5_9MICO|nr:hypothetical protein [Isoptericola jiangsuensis]PFG42965.1 hypothetical protein ATJ88_1642 [Isoptericola jiangsuensis]